MLLLVTHTEKNKKGLANQTDYLFKCSITTVQRYEITFICNTLLYTIEYVKIAYLSKNDRNIHLSRFNFIPINFDLYQTKNDLPFKISRFTFKY